MSYGYSVDEKLDEGCKSCPSCNIEFSSRSLPQRKQHIRRCNQPRPGDDGTYSCHACTNNYKSYAGLRQHIKRSHPVEYNVAGSQLTCNRIKSAKSKWTAQEEKQLARLELSLPAGLSQKEVNTTLADLHTKRTFESIKKQRQKTSLLN